MMESTVIRPDACRDCSVAPQDARSTLPKGLVYLWPETN